MTRTKITTIKGKRIAKITSDAAYFSIHLENADGLARGVLTVRVDALFDKDGNLFEDNLPYTKSP